MLSHLVKRSNHYMVNSVIFCGKDAIDERYIFCSFPLVPLTKEIHHGSVRQCGARV